VTYLDLVDHPSYDVVRGILVAMLVAASAVLVREVVAAVRSPRTGEPGEPGLLEWYPAAYLGLWLAVFAALWVVAGSAGSWPYLLACYALSVAVLLAAAARSFPGTSYEVAGIATSSDDLPQDVIHLGRNHDRTV
jgi:hypothetical protein